jgi:hemerythrin-like metal-binding protein
MLFPWKDEYSTGITEIDDQHKSLIKMINDLYEAMQDGSGGAMLTPLLVALADYTENHFTTEERYMAEADYAEIDEHRREHAQMTAKVAELTHKHRSGKAAISIQTLMFLRDWLTRHICGTDKRMAPSLNIEG